MSHVACGEIISDHFGWMEEGEFEVSQCVPAFMFEVKKRPNISRLFKKRTCIFLNIIIYYQVNRQ
jgi:hypothetical protein